MLTNGVMQQLCLQSIDWPQLFKYGLHMIILLQLQLCVYELEVTGTNQPRLKAYLFSKVQLVATSASPPTLLAMGTSSRLKEAL